MASIAIIGTGISGMAAAYFLRDRYDITFYEKNDYPGGHTHTVTVKEGERDVPIDTGFIVYNEITYPHLTRFFRELNVRTQPTSMSFSVQHVPSGLEFCGTGLNGLFAQRRNLVSPRFYKLLGDIDRFNKESVTILDQEKYLNYTLEQYVREQGYGDDFLCKFLVPMSSAVWSTPSHAMLQFPAVALVRFFKNHGFLGGLRGHYTWRTVTGGSQQYRDKVLAMFPGKVGLNNPAARLRREPDKVHVRDSRGQWATFDKVIVACHADEALALLEDPTLLEADLLKKFRYLDNETTLHTDESVMPKTRRAWSSWNYRIQYNRRDELVPTTIYHMNRLQQVSDHKQYFVSINDPGAIDPAKILWRAVYTHPLFDVAAWQAQPQLPRLNQNGVTYYCGAYFRNGFHEDGFTAGLEAARSITGEPLWP